MSLSAIRIFASLLWRNRNPCLGLVRLPRFFHYKQHVLNHGGPQGRSCDSGGFNLIQDQDLGAFSPVVPIDQGPDTAARKQSEHCTQPSVQKDRRRSQPKRMSLTLRALISIAVILSCRERLVLSGAIATLQRREVSEVAAQGCDCQLADFTSVEWVPSRTCWDAE